MKALVWNKHLKRLVMVVLTIPLLSGCWDRQEIEERAVVLGIGIDAVSPEEIAEEDRVSHLEGAIHVPEGSEIRLTAQIAVPGRIPLGPGEGGGAGKGGQSTVMVVSVVGHTIDDAINNMQQQVSKPIFLGHLRIIAVSEALARRGTTNINEFLRRNPEVRRMNWMFVCKGKAEDLMKTSPELERVPTVYLLTMLDESVKIGRFPDNVIGKFWSETSSKGREGFLPYLELKKKGVIQVSGLAYFKGEKLVGVTEPLEIALFMGIEGMNPAGGEAFVQIPDTSKYVMFGGRSRKAQIRSTLVNGMPAIRVKILLEGNLVEKSGDAFTLEPETIKIIQRSLANEAQLSYEKLIKKTQSKNSDIFGFGEYVRAKLPSYWNREIHTKEDWQTAYRDLPVKVEVIVNIRRVGMKAK